MSMFGFWHNRPSSTVDFEPPLLSLKPGVAIPYLVMIVAAMLVGLLGNMLIVGSFFVSQRVRIVGNEFVLNLALADLFVTIFADPFLVLGVTAGEEWFAAQPGLCEFVASVCLGSCICAFLTLTSVTINRYLHVCHPCIYDSICTRFRMVALCVACWVVAFLLELANFLGWGGHKFDRKHNACMWDRTNSRSYTLFLLLGLITTPILIMATAYILIFLRIRKIKRRIACAATDAIGNGRTAGGNPPNPQPWGRSTMGKETWEVIKSTRTFFLILVAFVITWGPYAIVNASDAYDTFPLELHLYVAAWAHMHAAINFVIYCATNCHFRLAFRRLMCCPFPSERMEPKFELPQVVTTAPWDSYCGMKVGRHDTF